MKTNYIIRKWIWLIVTLLSFVWLSFATYNLKITEVFYDWSDEWIEIFNLWDQLYSWNLVISWAKSSNILINNIHIPYSWFVLVGDDWQNILDKNSFYSWYSLSISDTKEINIELIQSGQVLDNFYVSSSLVNQYNNYNTSFEKILSGDILILTSVVLDRTYNFSSPWLANPGKIYNYTWTIVYTWITQDIDSSTWSNSTWDNLTWSFSTWNNLWLQNTGEETIVYDTVYSYLNCKITKSQSYNSWNTLIWFFDINSIDPSFCAYPYIQKWYLNSSNIWTWCNISTNILTWENILDFQLYSGWQLLCSNTYMLYNEIYKEEVYLTGLSCLSQYENWKLIITEINPIDSIYPEYVEIKSIWIYSWQISFYGLWKWTAAKNIDINLSSWQYVIISDSYSGFLYTWDVLIINWISISDNWELLSIYGQNWQLLDSVIFGWPSSWKSTYFSYLSWDVRYFSSGDYYSPAFDEKYLAYNIKSKNNNCFIKLQNSSYFYAESSFNFVANLNWVDISNQSDFNCERTFSWGAMFTWCNPSYLKFQLPWIYRLNLKIKNDNSELCSTSYDLNYPSKNLLVTYWKSYYDDYVRYKDYYENLLSEKQCVQKSKSTKFTPQLFRILSVEAAPISWNAEKIEIETLTWDFDLYKLYINYANTTKLLTGYFSWTILTMTWNFRFNNNSSCITLRSVDEIFDKYCYKNTTKTSTVTRFITGFSLTWISVYFTWFEACIKYKWEQFLCKSFEKIVNSSLKPLKTQINLYSKDIRTLSGTIKKLEKSLLSFNKKYESLSWKYEKIRLKSEKYKDEIKQIKDNQKIKNENYKNKITQLDKKYKLQKQKLNTQIKTLKQDLYTSRSESRLNKNYSILLLWFIKTNWYMIYTWSELPKLEKIYLSMSNNLKKGKTDVELYWNLVKVYDIKKANEISNSLTPLTYRIKEKISSIIGNTKVNYLMDVLR